MSSSFSSSSFAPPSSWSWTSVACVVHWSVVGLVVVVVVMEVVGRTGCFSLLLTTSLSVESQSRVAREIVVVSVDSGWLLVCDGVSPSHLLACFRCPLCLVDIAGFHVE